ncbi:MAG TPA: CPBP family intramembrane glutamic endopeptidase [Candidatus Limnocylindrales bacterium]|nr:CPBP family intramembrane glutamic endopeptidase [Candidatus Limnocylindrales bacterium]
MAARWLRPAGLLAGLAIVIGARWAATVDGLDAIGVGVLFGAALVWVAVVGSQGTVAFRRPRVAEVVYGVVGGTALIAIAVVASSSVPRPIGEPAPSFAPWAAVTLLVAGAEELLLRGVLFRAVERAGGVVAAVAVTSIAFAVMHVPLYGWHVVPLDLGVGIFLGGLRLAGGGWLGPAIAHAIADLATWWL